MNETELFAGKQARLATVERVICRQKRARIPPTKVRRFTQKSRCTANVGEKMRRDKLKKLVREDVQAPEVGGASSLLYLAAYPIVIRKLRPVDKGKGETR